MNTNNLGHHVHLHHTVTIDGVFVQFDLCAGEVVLQRWTLYPRLPSRATRRTRQDHAVDVAAHNPGVGWVGANALGLAEAARYLAHLGINPEPFLKVAEGLGWEAELLAAARQNADDVAMAKTTIEGAVLWCKKCDWMGWADAATCCDPHGYTCPECGSDDDTMRVYTPAEAQQRIGEWRSGGSPDSQQLADLMLAVLALRQPLPVSH